MTAGRKPKVRLFDELRQRARDLVIELTNAQPPAHLAHLSPAFCRRRKTTSSPPAHAEPAVTAFGTADKQARAEAARHTSESRRDSSLVRASPPQETTTNTRPRLPPPIARNTHSIHVGRYRVATQHPSQSSGRPGLSASAACGSSLLLRLSRRRRHEQ